MGDLTSVDPDKAEVATKKISETTDNLSTAFNTLDQFLASRFGCWGEDETGKQFGTNYVPGYQDFMKNFRDMRDQLKQTADDLSKIPDEFRKTDEDNAGAIR